MNYVIFGIDRIGKNNFMEHVLPINLEINYADKIPSDVDPRKYAEERYIRYFNDLKNRDNICWNRGHLDEMIYGDLYRHQDPKWIKDMETANKDNFGNTIFTLLYTDDFSILTDDGLSLDFNRKEEEQALFEKYFEEIPAPYKIKIKVNDGNKYRDTKSICDEFWKTYYHLIK